MWEPLEGSFSLQDGKPAISFTTPLAFALPGRCHPSGPEDGVTDALAGRWDLPTGKEDARR